MIHPQDWKAGMPVRVKGIDTFGRLATMGTSQNSVQFHAEPWNQHAWWVHFGDSGELRLFSTKVIEVIEE